MKRRWIWAWLIQIGEMALIALLQAAAYGVHPMLYNLTLWIGLPAAGMITAARAVGRGLNNYLAWLAPAPCGFAAHLIVWGFSPSPGAGLLTALFSLIGAAAGEVLRRQRSAKRRPPRRHRHG